jgi:hypothetical protein
MMEIHLDDIFSFSIRCHRNKEQISVDLLPIRLAVLNYSRGQGGFSPAEFISSRKIGNLILKSLSSFGFIFNAIFVPS